MGTMEIAAKVKELKELQRMAEEVAAEMEAIKDTIKAELSARQVDQLAAGEYKVRWQVVKSSRLDTAALRLAAPDLCQRFTRETTTRRFSVA